MHIRLSILLLLLVCAFFAEDVLGQASGVILQKPTAWSKDSEAEPIEYISYVNHTGYWTVVRPKGGEVQIQTGTIVACLLYPRTDDFPSLVKQEEIDSINQQLRRG